MTKAQCFGNQMDPQQSSSLFEPTPLPCRSISLAPINPPLPDHSSALLYFPSFGSQTHDAPSVNGFNPESPTGNFNCPPIASFQFEQLEGGGSGAGGGNVEMCFCIESQTAYLHRMYELNVQRADVALDQVLTLARQAISSVEESLGCQACAKKNAMWICLLLLHRVGGCFEWTLNASVSSPPTLPLYFGSFQVNTTGREGEILAMAVETELQRCIELMQVLDEQLARQQQTHLGQTETPEPVAHLSNDLRKYFVLLKDRLGRDASSP
ncbi:hypothetical protein CFE70_005044 [Pyrenophora teres f. teres 0-1]|uniref:Uncharacterized protein n=1 Tax=Pyrenophora teres f. teres (strain 0-1) TaxID=861557 RepID=E3RNR6_PYRTT|nr:hypothetical protein PTT_10229 [Pyrenophora teres f. teres 0-1]